MKKAYLWIFLALLVAYVVLAFTLPADPQVLHKLGVSQAKARWLGLSVVLPIVGIYLAALYGFMRIKDYAEKVRKTKEGPYFHELANGLTVLALSLPIGSVISSLANYVKFAYPHFFSDISIVRNYVSLLFTIVAIVLISRGARGLYGTLKSAPRSTQGYSLYGLVGPILLASVFTWLIISQGQSTPGGAPYFLPEWLIVTTIAVPYVFVWCIGAEAAWKLYKYQNGVKGVIYKRAIDNLAKGIGAIIVLLIAIRFLSSLSGLLNRLEVTPLFLVLYLLIAFYALGFGLVARGAKKLKQIEEA